MEKKLLITKRKKAKKLSLKGWSIRKISRHLVSSKASVSKWINMNEEEVMTDNRGWKKGKLRKYAQQTKERVKQIREQLEAEQSFFIGAKVVQKNYEHRYGETPSKSFIDSTLKGYGLVKSPQKKEKGKSRYMHYPVNTLNKLGKSMLSIDFIGPKYLEGSNNRINFLSCKYIRPAKEGIVKRIEGQTTQQVIKVLKDIWRQHPIPEVLKVDNDGAFGANSTHDMCVGKLTLFLLNLGVKPLYIATRSPWNNGEVEGFNSVFSKKFWNKLQFDNEAEIDIKIKDFNLAYEKYSNLIENNPPIKSPEYISGLKGIDLENKKIHEFKAHHIYFLRVVRRKGQKGNKEEIGFINILNKEIELNIDMINLFVFCIIDIKSCQMIIKTENKDGQLDMIKELPFKIKNLEYA